MSRLLFNEQPLVIDKKLAQLIGVNEAIVLQQINYWIEINKKADKNFYEDKYWTYNTIEEWQEEFPFWSIDTVKRTLTKLRKMNIIITGNFNKLKIDRTLWYTINYEELERLDKENESVEKEEVNEQNKTDNIPVDNLEQEHNPNIKNEEKPIETLKFPISAKCPNGENPISAKCTNASGQIAPMHQGKMPSPLPEISTETSTEISFQSISQSENKKDGLTDRPSQEINYNQIINNCEIDYLDDQYKDAVTHAIRLLCLDIENKKRIAIGENIIPTDIVRNDLEKLNFFTIQHAIHKFEEASKVTKIKNTVAYLKSCIYNAIHEINLDVDNELRYEGLI